jgi:hypothetical protein
MVQISLADLGPGKWAKMVMVKGIDLPLVAPLEKSALLAGKNIKLIEKSPNLIVETENDTLILDPEFAKLIFVQIP